jgi:hypothetical protein
MQLRIFTIGIFALCSGASALQAQEVAPTPPEQAAPASRRLGVGGTRAATGSQTRGCDANSSCAVDARKLLAQLRLETKANAHHDPQLELEWYRGPLAAAYVAPPVGFAVAALALDKEAIAMPILAGLLGLTRPAIVHAAHDNSADAWYSVLGVIGSIAAGGLLGAAVGDLAPGSLSRADAPPHASRRDEQRDYDQRERIDPEQERQRTIPFVHVRRPPVIRRPEPYASAS